MESEAKYMTGTITSVLGGKKGVICVTVYLEHEWGATPVALWRLALNRNGNIREEL